MKKKITIILSIALVFNVTSCKQECGCDAPFKQKLTNTEAQLFVEEDLIGVKISGTQEVITLCNTEIIEEDLKNSINGDLSGASILIIEGALSNECSSVGFLVKKNTFIAKGLRISSYRIIDNQSI